MILVLVQFSQNPSVNHKLPKFYRIGHNLQLFNQFIIPSKTGQQRHYFFCIYEHFVVKVDATEIENLIAT